MGLPPPDRPKELLEPFRELGIQPPKASYQEAGKDEELLKLWGADKVDDERKRYIEEQDTERESENEGGEPPTHGHLRLRSRHLPAPTLAANLRAARILVVAWAEFYVIAAAAPIAIKWLACRDVS